MTQEGATCVSREFFSLLAIISLSGLFACDFYPGSAYKTSQTMRTWIELDAQSEPACMLVGSYRFTQPLQIPNFNLTSKLRLRPENRQDREFLPIQASLQYHLNDQLFYQVNYDLNRSARATTRLRRQSGGFFDTDDVVDTWFCIQDGFMPIHTRVDWSKNMRFLRESAQQEF